MKWLKFYFKLNIKQLKTVKICKKCPCLLKVRKKQLGIEGFPTVLCIFKQIRAQNKTISFALRENPLQFEILF